MTPELGLISRMLEDILFILTASRLVLNFGVEGAVENCSKAQMSALYMDVVHIYFCQPRFKIWLLTFTTFVLAFTSNGSPCCFDCLWTELSVVGHDDITGSWDERIITSTCCCLSWLNAPVWKCCWEPHNDKLHQLKNNLYFHQLRVAIMAIQEDSHCEEAQETRRLRTKMMIVWWQFPEYEGRLAVELLQENSEHEHYGSWSDCKLQIEVCIIFDLWWWNLQHPGEMDWCAFNE